MSQTNVENAVINGEISEPIAAPAKRGLSIKRFFTKFGHHPFEEIDWDLRTAAIQNEKGEVIFEQRDVEVPREWSQTATNIVASKYFHGKLGTKERESSVRQLITRVADTIAQWGVEGGYFVTQEAKWIFRDELVHLLVRQKASFNSPVWFNCGLWQKYYLSLEGGGWYFDPATGRVEKETEAYRHPQCSACFINSVQDNLESILCLARTEGMLFKYGSGTGTNLSPIRSSLEGLSGGGVASGPLSFMKGYDTFAGVIKSGGKTRRAAKMVILNIDHPDVLDFIECKSKEERKARALIDAGYDASLDGERVKALILVDMVADRHLDILRESNSTPWLSDLVFDTARELGYARSFSGGVFPVEDDHMPFLREGVPTVDIIDLTPFTSYHHTALDTLDKCSPESLAVVGRVVLVTLARLEELTRVERGEKEEAHTTTGGARGQPALLD